MKTEKAKLMHLLEKDIEFDYPEYGECTAIVSGMTLVLSLVGFPATFRDLADKVLCLLLSCKTADFVSDTTELCQQRRQIAHGVDSQKRFS